MDYPTEAECREHVWDAGLMRTWLWECTHSGDDGLPFEPKANDWGWLDGKPVAVDYANLDKDTSCPP
jgi:hypothetical protein